MSNYSQKCYYKIILPQNPYKNKNFKKNPNFHTSMDKKGPHTNPHQLRGGLRGGLTNSETESKHTGWSDIKSY